MSEYMFQNVFNPLYSIKFANSISLIMKTAAKAASLYVNIFKVDVPAKKGNNKNL